MGILSSNQYVSEKRINCGGEFTASLSLSGINYSSSIPLEIAIVVDGKAETLVQAKADAKDFIAALRQKFGGGSTLTGLVKVTVVGFGRDIPVHTDLTNDVSALNNAVDSVPESDESNISLAISYAANTLVNSPQTDSSIKMMILYTNGDANFGSDPLLAAQTARAAGVNVYIDALAGTKESNLVNMLLWASQPGTAFLLKGCDTDNSYSNFIANLTANNFYNTPTSIAVTAKVDENFVISCASSATTGIASLIDNRTIKWEIEYIALDSAVEGTELKFIVQHVGDETGTFSLDESITFTDDDSSAVTFTNPEIVVNCGDIVIVDDCPEPIETASETCGEVITIDAGEITTELMGRIAEISATIKNVCPGRRVALAAVLTELDEDGFEHPRGMRTVTIPSHSYPECHDIRVEALKIVIPGDIDDVEVLPCGERNFRTRIYVNYIDSGFVCEGI